MPEKTDEFKVVTGPVRLSYVHVFEAYSSDPKKEPRYSCAILVPKSDRATIRAIKAAIEAAKEKGKTSVWGGRIPPGLKITFRDGDDPEQADHEKNPEYRGHFFMNISSKQKPGIVDAYKDEIVDESEIYSGVWARVSMRAFPFNQEGSKGVSFGLNNIQKIRDDEPLGGRSRAEDDFDAWQGDDGGTGDEDII